MITHTFREAQEMGNQANVVFSAKYYKKCALKVALSNNAVQQHY